jgi:hypothetical protein
MEDQWTEAQYEAALARLEALTDKVPIQLLHPLITNNTDDPNAVDRTTNDHPIHHLTTYATRNIQNCCVCRTEKGGDRCRYWRSRSEAGVGE